MNATRKIITSILIALFFLPSYAQEFKTKKISTERYLETFSIDKKSKLRNGEYLKIDRKTKDTLISGIFRDDLKTGIWRYNSKGTQPWITYDYDKKTLTRISDQISKIDSFMIRKDGFFVTEKVDAPPVYLGFKDELKNTLEMNFRVPIGILEERLSEVSIASFIVDKNGKMKDFEIVKTSSAEVGANIKNILKEIDGEWSPAIFNGQPAESKIFIVFDIVSQGGSSTIPKISNAIVTHFAYYYVADQRRISGRVVVVPSGSVMPGRMPIGIPGSFNGR
jgi:hypothetical protein